MATNFFAQKYLSLIIARNDVLGNLSSFPTGKLKKQTSISEAIVRLQVIASYIENEVRAVISPHETTYKLERNSIKRSETQLSWLAKTWALQALMWRPYTILHCPSSARKGFMKFTIFGLDIWSTHSKYFFFFPISSKKQCFYRWGHSISKILASNVFLEHLVAWML